jgi:hypothetical protein
MNFLIQNLKLKAKGYSMKKFLSNKKNLIFLGIGLVVFGIIAFIIFSRSGNKAEVIEPPTGKPKKPVNIISQSDRPFVTLQPLSGRNKLEFIIHDLKKDAKEVEVTLEYDRNKGVLDAVLYTFTLDKTPFEEEIFLGSKSAGGSVTYHDDVIGGALYLDFSDNDYTLEVPWRYIDTESSYSLLSTTDARFQLSLEDPIKQSKVIIMESPGLPENVKGEVLAGPYYVSTVGNLPQTSTEIKIRLLDEVESATIMGWDGGKWVEYDTTLDGKTAMAEGDLLSTYIVVK